MKFIRLFSFLLFIHLTLITISFGQNNEQVAKLYDQIKNVSLDEEKVAEVEGIILKRDVAIFRLNKGKICLFEPIDGKITGAVFVGEGIFEFLPPTEIEKNQLRKFTDHETLNEEFEELYLAFSDSTGIELEHKLNFSAGEVPEKFTSIKDDCPKRSMEETGKNLWVRLLADIVADSMSKLNYPDRYDGFFYAEIKTKDLGRLFFTFDPKEVEEISLEKPTAHVLMRGPDLVCSFHREEDYRRNSSVRNTPIQHENKDEIKVSHYKMDVEIDISEKLVANVEMDFENLVDGIRVINFDLYPKLKIDKISDETEDSLYFIQDKDHYNVAVVLSRPTKSDKTHKLVFRYSGKAIDQNWWGDLYVKSSTKWYPRYGFRERATYDLTFKCPKGYKLVSIGNKTEDRVGDDFRYTRWVENFPVVYASFNYGDFKIYELKRENIPPVSVYYLEESDRKYAADYNRKLDSLGHSNFVVLGAKTKENIVADVANSLNFFQTSFGKYPFSKMAATEIPAEEGQGTPSLLRFAWSTFQKDVGFAGYQEDMEFTVESFRAHEVSHQWWGHIVGWETYHDQWLGEGFAEYSGAWYAQLSSKDTERFFKELEEWRKDILGKGSVYSEGTASGPLWLGQRLDCSKSSDYATLVYKKGAYVLHMLRNMMMDYNTKSDDKFIGMMRDFVQTYYGKEASTEDFKQIVEKHIGEDMSWFFDQWVYGMEIPTYIFSYTTEKTSEGKYLVTCDIAQENVSEGFKMWIPVLLDFGKDQYAVLRILINKPHATYQLPKAPLMPKKVILNPYHAVLCEVKNK